MGSVVSPEQLPDFPLAHATGPLSSLATFASEGGQESRLEPCPCQMLYHRHLYDPKILDACGKQSRKSTVWTHVIKIKDKKKRPLLLRRLTATLDGLKPRC